MQGCHHSSIARQVAAGLLMLLLPFVSLAMDKSQRLVAVFPEHFPPIFSVTANGVPTGYGIESLEAVAGLAGLQIEYRPVPSWADALAALRNGEADLIPNLGITESRSQHFEFTQSICEIPVSMFTRSDFDGVTSLENVEQGGYVVGVVKKNVAVKIMQQHPDIPVKVFDSMGAALIELKNYGVDVIIYPRLVFQNFAQELGFSHDIKAVGQPLVVVQRGIAIRKDRTDILPRLNRAIEQLRGTPAFEAIYQRWHAHSPAYWSRTRLFILAGSLLLVIIMAAFVGRFLFLGRLNRRLNSLNTFNHAVLDATIEGIVVLDHNGILTLANPAAQAIFARTADQLVGKNLAQLLPTKEALPLLKAMQDFIQSGNWTSHADSNGSSNAFALKPDGSVFPIRLGIRPTQISGKVSFVCTVHDMSDQIKAEQELAYLTDHDPLTGLLNLRGVKLVLESLLHQAQRNKQPLACICMGLKEANHINEVYGRQAGDAVLMQVTNFLQEQLRSSDSLGHVSEQVLARSGGDRFLLVLPDTGASGALALTQRLLQDFKALAVEYAGNKIRLDNRIGIATFPEHGENPDELISHAETALHIAKQSADTSHLFTIDDQQQERQLEDALDLIHSGLEQHLFTLYYQPILQIASQSICHYEVLARLIQSDGRVAMPADFIPAAEKFGLIRHIDYRILELAFDRLKELNQKQNNIALSINLSAAHIGDDALFRYLSSTLETSDINPQNIIFEITETAALHNLSRAKSFMDPLRSLGCRFALDDFGVGFTSFAQLRVLPVDIVKIDGMFIRNLPNSLEDQALVKAITEIAHSLDKYVVAEFVESAEILDYLHAYGIDFAQGYHIGKPSPEFLSEKTARTTSTTG